MAAIDKVRNDTEKTKTKIVEQQKWLRELEQKAAEEENLEVVRMVKAAKLNDKKSSAPPKAYASGRISLPGDMQADLKEQEDSEDGE